MFTGPMLDKHDKQCYLTGDEEVVAARRAVGERRRRRAERGHLETMFRKKNKRNVLNVQIIAKSRARQPGLAAARGTAPYIHISLSLSSGLLILYLVHCRKCRSLRSDKLAHEAAHISRGHHLLMLMLLSPCRPLRLLLLLLLLLSSKAATTRESPEHRPQVRFEQAFERRCQNLLNADVCP
jgi:hypothetical protein